MQLDTYWCWNQQPKYHVTTVPTLTIIRPQLEVNSVTAFMQYPKVYVPGHKQKIYTKTAYIFD